MISGCLLSRKIWWAVRIGSFCPKLRYFIDQKGPKVRPPEKLFQIQKRKFKIVRAEKVDESNGVICLVSVFPSWVMVVELSKKVFFSSYMHLKGLFTHIQKMILFIILWLTVSKMLGFEVVKFCKLLLS